MVIWGFEIGDRYLKFRQFCIKIIIKGIQKSEITDCDTGGCGMWVETISISSVTVNSKLRLLRIF
ncbi:MAG: hypothetical protein ACK48B_16555 [Dolichospermum sp.]|jgi:hypothetical protein